MQLCGHSPSSKIIVEHDSFDRGTNSRVPFVQFGSNSSLALLQVIGPDEVITLDRKVIHKHLNFGDNPVHLEAMDRICHSCDARDLQVAYVARVMQSHDSCSGHVQVKGFLTNAKRSS